MYIENIIIYNSSCNCHICLKELSEVPEDPAFAQERARHEAVIQHQRRSNILEILHYNGVRIYTVIIRKLWNRKSTFRLKL